MSRINKKSPYEVQKREMEHILRIEVRYSYSQQGSSIQLLVVITLLNQNIVRYSP